MTKPVIVLRSDTAPSPLTYTQLDANFTNLQNSTINFTDGTNTRSMDLNDVTTLAGDKNIQLTVNESTQTITVKNTLSDYTFDPIGFENLTDATVSFNDSTRTLTIAPVGSSYRYWWRGKQVTVTTSKTITIPNTSGNYFIYFNDETLSYQVNTEPEWSSQVSVSYVAWNAAAGQSMFSKELHTISMDWKTKEYLHETQGAQYAEGLAISNYTTTGTGANNADAQLDISNGLIYDQDIGVAITHSNTPTANTWEQDLQGPARIPVVYHSGANGGWIRDAARDYPVKNGTSLVTYNLNTGGTWTTPDITSTHFVAYWIVATNFVNNPIIAIMGQRHDNKLVDAVANSTWASLDLSNFPAQELRPLYRVIFRSGSAYANTPKAYIAQVDDFRFSTIIPQGGLTASTNTIYDGDTSVTITDTGIGQVDFTVDGTLMVSLNDNDLDLKSHNIINVDNIVGIRASIPDLRYQSVGTGASVIYPSGGSFSINLGSNTLYGRQTVWDISNCNSSVTCTISMNYDSGHPSDLLFFNNGSSKTLTISIPLNSVNMYQKVFWDDATQYSGASTKALTLDSSRVTWLRFTKVMSEASGQIYTHWINVEFITNNRTIP